MSDWQTVIEGQAIRLESRDGIPPVPPVLVDIFRRLDEDAVQMAARSMAAFAKALDLPLWFITGDRAAGLRWLAARDRAWQLASRRRRARQRR